MYQPHPATIRVRKETEESAFVKKLAAAIVLRAIQDLFRSNDRPADGAVLSDRAERNGFSGRMCLQASRHGPVWRS